jgi:hypothetical protein
MPSNCWLLPEVVVVALTKPEAVVLVVCFITVLKLQKQQTV